MKLTELESHVAREGQLMPGGTVEIETGQVLGGDVYKALTKKFGTNGVTVEMMGGKIMVKHEAMEALVWCIRVLEARA